MLKRIYSVFLKELNGYFYSSIAYVFLFLFILIPNILFFYFFGGIFGEENATMRTYFMMLPYIFIIFIPGLTMGAWAKEKNTGTLELLLTLPVRQHEILFGKFIAALLIVLISLTCSLFIPILTYLFLGNFDPGQLVTQYFGAVLMACTYISISFFLSSLTMELINSFFLTASFLLILTLAGYLSMVMKFHVLLEWLQKVLSYIGLQTHFANFSKGVIDSRDLAYYIGTTAIFIYLNIRTLEIKRWS
ncbi:MAG: ABC transporter permease subunit [Spirochaetes bacterium]|nr:ABC transporter permease subunit [Spirochaetota bacterium]